MDISSVLIENNMQVIQNTKTRTSLCPRDPIPGHREKENEAPKRQLHCLLIATDL